MSKLTEKQAKKVLKNLVLGNAFMGSSTARPGIERSSYHITIPTRRLAAVFGMAWGGKCGKTLSYKPVSSYEVVSAIGGVIDTENSSESRIVHGYNAKEIKLDLDAVTKAAKLEPALKSVLIANYR